MLCCVSVKTKYSSAPSMSWNCVHLQEQIGSDTDSMVTGESDSGWVLESPL